MRRVLAAVLITLSVLLGLVGAAQAPAGAGDGFWSATVCFGGWPNSGMWWGVKGSGVYFRSQYGYFGVLGRFYAAHAAGGAECSFGFPISDPIPQDGALVQYFYPPSQPCALRAIVVWPNGSTVPVTAANYFC